MRRPLTHALVIGHAAVSGCVAFVPESRDPRTLAAAEIKRTCTGARGDVASIAPLDTVEPLYVRRPSKSGHDTHLMGARLRLRPVAGVTPQLLERALRCHQARAALADIPVTERDPWVLPGVWMNIEVQGDGAELVASVSSDRGDEARAILARATRVSRGAVTSP